jgi:hypothetical protein
MKIYDRLLTEHPDLDPWLYREHAYTAQFGKMQAYIADGQRTVYKIECEGIPAYQKFDSEERNQFSMDGAREKLASDLAQVLGIAVPGTLVWRDRYFGKGCVQKEPPGALIQTLDTFHRALEFATPEQRREVIEYCAGIYEPRGVFFDVWVGNIDRATNYRNTLIAETSSGSVFWLIDFNCALSTSLRPWNDASSQEHGFCREDVPIPTFLARHPVVLRNVENVADHMNDCLSRIDKDLIVGLSRRAFSQYEDQGGIQLADRIADCLEQRRSKVTLWTRQLIRI